MIWTPGAVAGFAYDAGFRDDALVVAVALVLATSEGDDAFRVEPFPGALSGRLGLYAIPRVYLSDDAQAGVGNPLKASQTAYWLTLSSGVGFEWAPEYVTGRYLARTAPALDAIDANDRTQPPTPAWVLGR